MSNNFTKINDTRTVRPGERGNLVEKNGVIEVGSQENEIIGRSTRGGVPATKGENADGMIHTHPNLRGERQVWFKNGLKRVFGFGSGESPADARSSIRRPGRSAYVSDKEVGLYISGEETIEFDRQERFKK